MSGFLPLQFFVKRSRDRFQNIFAVPPYCAGLVFLESVADLDVPTVQDLVELV